MRTEGTAVAQHEAVAQSMAATASSRWRTVGGGGIWSFLHVEDAASATVAALEGAPGIYNIVDDEPAPVRDWLPFLAEQLGASR